MNSRLRNATRVAGAATVLVPTVRRLMRNAEDIDVMRYFPVSVERLRQTRTRSLLAGSILGMAVGFAAGVLLAPRLREKMKIDEYAEQARERVTGTAHEVQQKAAETVHEAREKVESGMEDVREKVEAGMHSAQEKVQAGMQTVQEKTEAGLQTAQEKAHAGMQSAESQVSGMTGMAGGETQRPPYGGSTHWTAESVVPFLKNVHYPAGKREVRSIAGENGAPGDLLDRLDKLPDQTFRRADDITTALGLGTYEPTPEAYGQERGAA